VNAFWWLFKSGIKQTEKQLIISGEKIEAKEVEKSGIKHQIQMNKAIGNSIDDAFKKRWCTKHKYVSSVDEFRKTLKQADTVYITNDWEAKKYINLKFDFSFSRRPDMLEIKVVDGQIKNIRIYDTKSSLNAVQAAQVRGQSADYEKLCLSINKKNGRDMCQVDYILPKNEAEKLARTTDNEIVDYLAIGILTFGPDPTDLLCLIG